LPAGLGERRGRGVAYGGTDVTADVIARMK